MKQIVIPTNNKIRIPGTEVFVLHHYGANIILNYEIRETSEGDSAPAQQDASHR